MDKLGWFPDPLHTSQFVSVLWALKKIRHVEVSPESRRKSRIPFLLEDISPRLQEAGLPTSYSHSSFTGHRRLFLKLVHRAPRKEMVFPEFFPSVGKQSFPSNKREKLRRRHAWSRCQGQSSTPWSVLPSIPPCPCLNMLSSVTLNPLLGRLTQSVSQVFHSPNHYFSNLNIRDQHIEYK